MRHHADFYDVSIVTLTFSFVLNKISYHCIFSREQEKLYNVPFNFVKSGF